VNLKNYTHLCLCTSLYTTI